jgi:putative flippase GtrA
MANRLVGGGQIDSPESSTVGDLVAPMGIAGHPAQPQAPTPTYVPTGVARVDSLLALADRVTRGKAGVLQRTVSYLIIGGFAAVVNLVCLVLLYNVTPMPFSDGVHWNVAFVLAAEISILANFIPNDYFTFRHLPGHARSWWQRCWRFHSTAIAGTLVTYVVSWSLLTWVHMIALFAEAIAIIIALVFNFTFHHIWTYRHVRPAH